MPSAPRLTTLAFLVGVGGGSYGIGGGSLLGQILAGRGLPVARVAPAALAATFATSVVDAAAYSALSLAGTGDVAPDWWLGIACGAGGLQPLLPENTLRVLLGTLATALGSLYVIRALN